SKIFAKSEKVKIENCLGVESEYCTLAKLDIPGSCGIATNKGCLVHRDATEEEIEVAKELLKVRINIGTMNFGSPFVGSSTIANSNGALAGLLTSGPEVANFIETMK
ncbi:MAG: translation initiation factor 6, partial [Candidatus Aenigmarchaeota archaeon]|nr:translation initiation factor 6 [Candidatus Aenigmarchaeota archaeon]